MPSDCQVASCPALPRPTHHSPDACLQGCSGGAAACEEALNAVLALSKKLPYAMDRLGSAARDIYTAQVPSTWSGLGGGGGGGRLFCQFATRTARAAALHLFTRSWDASQGR